MVLWLVWKCHNSGFAETVFDKFQRSGHCYSCPCQQPCHYRRHRYSPVRHAAPRRRHTMGDSQQHMLECSECGHFFVHIWSAREWNQVT